MKHPINFIVICVLFFFVTNCSKKEDFKPVPTPTPVVVASLFSFTTPTVAYAPLLIQFSNNSSNATTYKWDFGDGTTDISKEPKHTFESAGTFTVTLTSINGVVENKSSQTITVLSKDLIDISDYTVLMEYPSLWDIHTKPQTPNPPTIPIVRGQKDDWKIGTLLTDLAKVVDATKYDFVLFYTLSEVPQAQHSGTPIYVPAKNLGFDNRVANKTSNPVWTQLRGTPHLNTLDYSVQYPNYPEHWSTSYVAMHEMHHHWGVFIAQNQTYNARGGVVNGVNQTIGPRQWQKGMPVAWLANVEGHWAYAWSDLPNGTKMPGLMASSATATLFNDFDLYAMGLKTYDEIKDTSYDVYPDGKPNERYPVTIDSLISSLKTSKAYPVIGDGKRIPALDPTAKNIRALMVVVKGKDEVITGFHKFQLETIVTHIRQDWPIATKGLSNIEIKVYKK